jgi:S1 RNA binding domain protein
LDLTIEFFIVYEYNVFIRLSAMLRKQGGITNSMTIEVGSVLEGTVTGITKFGAFVELPDKKVGLVHISEVANEYVKDVHDFLKVQDKVNVKVLSVDEKGKIALSIKQTQAAPEKKEFRPRREFHQHNGFNSNRRSSGPVSFEDRLSKFMKESDERLMDLKRNTESKRGGRGARHAD